MDPAETICSDPEADSDHGVEATNGRLPVSYLAIPGSDPNQTIDAGNGGLPNHRGEPAFDSNRTVPGEGRVALDPNQTLDAGNSGLPGHMREMASESSRTDPGEGRIGVVGRFEGGFARPGKDRGDDNAGPGLMAAILENRAEDDRTQGHDDIPTLVDRRTAASRTLPSTPQMLDGVTVPGYDLLEELGRGGMGVVYKARDRRLHRLVALKMILGGAHVGPIGLARFRTEAEAVAKLHHPNIVQIFETGECDGRPYLTLEFVDGGSLEEQIRNTPTSPRAAAELVETMARAMEFAHQQGIVHRDLKPANVLLARREGQIVAGPEEADRVELGHGFALVSDHDAQDRRFRAGQARRRRVGQYAEPQRHGHAVLHGARAGGGP